LYLQNQVHSRIVRFDQKGLNFLTEKRSALMEHRISFTSVA
jgi:hypothetical protein